jgi:hypothetical protein
LFQGASRTRRRRRRQTEMRGGLRRPERPGHFGDRV